MPYYPTAVNVYVDFANGPFATPETWTDVTQWVTGRVRYDWGRSSAVDDFQPGKGSFTLMNDDSRFDPSNTAGPYYGTLKPRRRCKITVTTPAGTHVVAYGAVEGWPQRWEGRKTGYVDVTFTDLVSLFAQIQMPESVWDWRVKETAPFLWYKLGDSTTAAVSDSSTNALPGEWRVYEGGGTPLSGVLMPKAVIDAGKVAGVTPSSDRQSASWAELQAAVGQPLGGIVGTPRTPAFVPAWDTQSLPSANFTVVLWVLYRQAFPVDIRNIYSSTTPLLQPLVTWGQTEGHYWQFGIRTDGKLEFRFVVGATTYATDPFGTSLDDGQPHQVSCGRLSNLLYFSVDGVLLTNVDMAAYLPAPVYPAVIGSAKQNLSSLQSTIGDVLFWNSYQNSAVMNELWYAGRYGSTSVSVTSLRTDTAFTQGFTLAKVTTANTVTFSNGQTVTETISGQSFGEYLRKLAATEQGLLFGNRTGAVTFHGRSWQTRTGSNVVQYTLGDQSGATLGYSDLDYRDPADSLENDSTVSHPAGSERTINQTSVNAYGSVAGSVDTFLASAAAAKAVADHRAWKYGTPPADGIIPDRLTVRPNTQAEFDMVCSLNIADRLQITRTRPNGTQLVDDYWAESVSHDFDASSGGEWTTVVGLSLADHPAKPFVLDTSALDGPDFLWV